MCCVASDVRNLSVHGKSRAGVEGHSLSFPVTGVGRSLPWDIR